VLTRVGRGGRLSRFAIIGVANTLIDLLLFALLQPHLGTVPATITSTAAGMTFSLVANALFAFGAERVTLKAAAQFVALNAVNLWLLQPLVILGFAELTTRLVADDYVAVLLAKVASLGVSTTINFLVYDRYIWPHTSVRHAPPA
jgi:putative flippase GtrA